MTDREAPEFDSEDVRGLLYKYRMLEAATWHGGDSLVRDRADFLFRLANQRVGRLEAPRRTQFHQLWATSEFGQRFQHFSNIVRVCLMHG